VVKKGSKRPVREEHIASEFLLPLLGIDITYGAAMVMAGEMARGVRWIEHCVRQAEQSGDASQRALGHLVLGEIYLHMTSSKARPTLAVLLKNLVFILRSAPFAPWKARRHLDHAVREARQAGLPYWLARGLFDLAVLSKTRGRWAEARRYLEEAHEIAMVHSTWLAERVRESLAVLPRG
jgi:hypothetical protein